MADRLSLPTHQRSDFQQQAIIMFSTVAAVLAVAAQGEPTTLAWWDAVLKFSLVGLAVLAGSKARRWVLIAVATVTAVAAGLSTAGVVGWIALMVAASSIVLERRNRVVAAVVAAFSSWALLHLPTVGFLGLQSIIAGICFAALFVSAYQQSAKRARKQFRLAVAGIAVVTTLLLLVGGLAMLGARNNVSLGLAAARQGLSAARAGDSAQLSQNLAIAEGKLRAAQDQVSGLSARTWRLVPIASQNQQAVELGVAQGASITSQAARAITAADLEDVSLADGAVDLQSLLDAAPQLAETVSSLTDAKQALSLNDSPWVVPPLSSRLVDLSREIDGVLPDARLASDAAATLPAMLGVHAPQTYFVVFGTPAESREFGGFMGSWAVLTFDNGRMSLGQSGRTNLLYEASAEALVRPDSASPWYFELARPTQYPQNLTASPDFAEVAGVASQVLDGAFTEELDGFLYLDAWALIDMLELTGPVQIPFQDAPLTTENAGQYFFNDQYLVPASERTEVFASLAAVASEVVDRVQTQTLPGPEVLGRVMGPAARAGRIQVITFDDTHNQFLESVKLLRRFGRSETTDFMAVVQSNALSNKMDLYLNRTINYDVEVDGGALEGTATVQLRSTVPDDAPGFALGSGASVGQNRVLLSFYSPHTLLGTKRDGVEIDYRSTVEFGLNRYLVDVTVAPTGENTVVEFEIAGFVQTNPYSLEVWHQPLVNSDQVSVSYQGDDGSVAWDGQLVENTTLFAK